jgi:archaellum biogenesis protein FlaJ (TadC family)
MNADLGDGRTSDSWDKIGFKNLLIGSIVFALILAWIIAFVYSINFNLVLFVAVQMVVIVAVTMIWPALNSK